MKIFTKLILIVGSIFFMSLLLSNLIIYADDSPEKGERAERSNPKEYENLLNNSSILAKNKKKIYFASVGKVTSIKLLKKLKTRLASLNDNFIFDFNIYSKREKKMIAQLFRSNSEGQNKSCLKKFIHSHYKGDRIKLLQPVYAEWKNNTLLVLVRRNIKELIYCNKLNRNQMKNFMKAENGRLCIPYNAQFYRFILEKGKLVLDGEVSYDGKVYAPAFDTKNQFIVSIARKVCP